MDTSASLLESLKHSDGGDSWSRLTHLYGPLIRKWMKFANANSDDQDDVLQEVLHQVSLKIKEFELGEQTGSFRSWLKKITINCLRNYSRKLANRKQSVGGSDFDFMIQGLADPHSELSKAWDEEHERSVMNYLLKIAEPRFSHQTWTAFYRTAIQNRSVTEVSKELKVSAGSIHTAKARVLAELRKLGVGLLKDE